ncbi:MAG: tRNA pseudouridine(55) synthase TruB [Thermodesulfobacteriota bacterium]
MDLAGILVIDKPKGLTSHDVVLKVRKAINVRKVGHLGTLDPMATGVLPLCIGRATKIARFLDNVKKEYVAKIRFGVETDSYDATGRVIAETDTSSICEEDVRRTLQLFKGKMEQIPPMFSAIKVNGTPLYKLARKGIYIERKPREIEIHSIDIEEVNLPYLVLRISCSKGTYIRSLGHDIGMRLGCGANLVALRRIKNGQFTLEDSIGLDQPYDKLIEKIIDTDDVISSIPDAAVNG